MFSLETFFGDTYDAQGYENAAVRIVGLPTVVTHNVLAVDTTGSLGFKLNYYHIPCGANSEQNNTT